jgi:hypothetical protein
VEDLGKVGKICAERESNHMKLGRRLRSFSYVKVGRKIGMYGDNMNTPETRE